MLPKLRWEEDAGWPLVAQPPRRHLSDGARRRSELAADGKGQAWASQRQSPASLARGQRGQRGCHGCPSAAETAGPGVLVLPKCPGARIGRGGELGQQV